MYLIKAMLLAFLAFQFFSCDNEPLTGEFSQDEQNGASEGQFKAKIEGDEFIAVTATAILNSDNEIVIMGEKSGGKKITLGVANAAVGSFSLLTGGANENAGAYFDGSANSNPYKTSSALGGNGQLKITKLDDVTKTVSGTFNILGVRIRLDSNGNPVLDTNGNPVKDKISITSGSFNSIPYILDDTGGGGGTGNPNNEFFAKVDGVSFIAESITVTESVISTKHMIKVEATSRNGELMRIDIPRSLGVGTFNMVRISDGTNLIAVYNAGTGTENLTSNPGSITITEFDLELGVFKAIFNFTGTDPLNQVPDVVRVTEGRMIIHFEGILGGNNTFRANVNSAAYIPDQITVTTSVVNQYPRVTISTTKGTQKMELTFPLTVAEATYEMETKVIDGDEIVGSYTPVNGTSITYVSSPGSLIITNYDMQNGIIEGIFNYTAKDATGQDPSIYQISGGTFYLVIP